MTDSVVVEGYARLKEGKKWKTRWIVLRKPSPVADCLVLLVFKDKSDKVDGNKERASVTLEEICGLESGRWCEGAPFTLAILCLTQAALLGFDSKETLQAWEVRLRYGLGEVHRFSVGVLAGTKLESGPATLHVCNNLLALVRDASPVVVGHWNLPDLRRYGPVPNGFVFEGGTRCGYWAGVFLLTSSESEQISFLFDCIVRGVSPTRVPFGLQPILPDPNTSQINSEERLNHETQELEKRLSMLSNRNSTASSMYCASPGGDDRSISGSSDTSDTSQSDGSVSSCLAIWTESSSNLSDNNVGKTGAGVEKQFANRGGNASGVKDPRHLKEMGRQSSLDSGIATGSHSSYSGSFSSYTGSLDNTCREDFGSVFCLPPHLAQDLSPCSCPSVSGHEYKVPTSLRYLYDTPRSLAQEFPSSAKDSPDPVPEYLKGASEGPLKAVSSHSRKTRGAASCDSVEPCTIKTIVTICSVCGGLQGMPFNPASSVAIPALPDKRPSGGGEKHRADPAYEIMESRAERTSEAEEKSKYQLMLSCGPQKLLQETEGTALAYHPEALLAERSRGDSVTYVNIPVSPTSKKQLNYMELELQEPGTRGNVVPATAQSKGKGSTKYAQIDITATETAHKVGTQHALGRQEGLHTLERRRKGTPH